jgi:hypothetical protein
MIFRSCSRPSSEVSHLRSPGRLLVGLCYHFFILPGNNSASVNRSDLAIRRRIKIATFFSAHSTLPMDVRHRSNASTKATRHERPM